MRGGVAPRDIGIISPYRSQLKLLRAAAALAPLVEAEGLEVQTVDRFQGRDKAVIVMSMVRSNARRDVGRLLAD